ncbi:serine protease inhibitor 77Ba-like [Bombyx mandarina]|uniref:Serpin-7 n=2 Tax=Bombyx TaxID=7090 RepID=C0J8F8_BOMMO|nr:serine protease inhibitor 7 precursor [Bombyx mori]XP_028039346.1 serine protease inhibitor 77Ba-like [Bombyx mandarina]ACG61172.1 serpin-7 [Bombyx mori]
MTRFISLISILLLTPGIYGQCNLKTAGAYFKRSLYEFSNDLAVRINYETDSHFVMSGLSAWTLISALSFGATDETLQEIYQVARLHPHKCFNNKIFKLLRDQKETAVGTLEKSSALFVDERMIVQEKFQVDVQKTGVCGVKVLSFDDTISSAATINQYVNEVTHSTIEEIVIPSDLEGVILVLIDALYFKGAWKTQFPYDDTEPSAFYNHQGNQIGDVNLMFVTGSFNLSRIDQLKSSVLELPYGNDGRFSMLIFRPHNDVTVSTVIQEMKSISLAAILDSFHGAHSVAVQIPRFKVTSDINNLKELLIDMGLITMFDSDRASFSDLSDYPVYVSNFIQKANIEVTEDGTVASSVSVVTFEARMLPDQFVVNRPFLYMIIDRALEIPLFIGAYSEPSLF